jgi:hypothetical protein
VLGVQEINLICLDLCQHYDLSSLVCTVRPPQTWIGRFCDSSETYSIGPLDGTSLSITDRGVLDSVHSIVVVTYFYIFYTVRYSRIMTAKSHGVLHSKYVDK